MDARELRIGNWVCDIPNRALQINLNHFLSEWFWHGVGSNLIEPVILDENWLTNLGCFKVYEDQNIWQIGVITFILTPEGVLLLDENKEPFFGAKPLRYIHGFQNLYYDLTGEELQFKTLG